MFEMSVKYNMQWYYTTEIQPYFKAAFVSMAMGFNFTVSKKSITIPCIILDLESCQQQSCLTNSKESSMAAYHLHWQAILVLFYRWPYVN